MPAHPDNPFMELFTNAASAIATIVGSVITGYFLARNQQIGVHATLKAEKLSLESRVAALQEENADLKAKISEIQKRYDQRFSDETIRSKYTFDEAIGMFVLNSRRFCHHCLLLSPPTESPLTFNADSHLTCRSCDTRHWASSVNRK